MKRRFSHCVPTVVRKRSRLELSLGRVVYISIFLASWSCRISDIRKVAGLSIPELVVLGLLVSWCSFLPFILLSTPGICLDSSTQYTAARNPNMSVMQPRARGVRDRRPNRRPAYFERRDVEADSDSESDDDDKLQSVDDDSDDDDDDDDKNKGITGNAAATTPIIGISTTAAPTLEVTLASPSPSLSLESSLPPPSSSPSPTGPAQSIASEPSSASIAPSSVASSVAQTKTTPTTFSTILPVPSAQNDSPSSSEVSQAPIPRVSSTSAIPADGDSQKDSTLVLASDNRSQAVGIAMGTICKYRQVCRGREPTLGGSGG